MSDKSSHAKTDSQHEEQNAPGTAESPEERAGEVADLARALDVRVAVAESLTSGRISSVLGRGEAASQWFRGGVVAYDEDVKFDVLGVTRGPVVTDSCAREMAEGVRRLLRADVTLGITGVGGPGPNEGSPAGTVHLALCGPGGTRSVHEQLDGDPAEVVEAATLLALHELARELTSQPGSRAADEESASG